jgi:hypothetical protein
MLMYQVTQSNSIERRDEKGTTSFRLSKGNYSSNNEVVFKEDFGDSERQAYFAN